MSATLSFVDRLFERAVELEKRGLCAAACRELRRLLHIRPLARRMVGQAAGRLGKLELERGQFARARRHLTMAVKRLPRSVYWRNLLAEAARAAETCAIDLGELEKTQRQLLQARFEHGHDPHYRQLWNHHQFQLLWARQQTARRHSGEETPILRFVPAAHLVGERLAN